jgi:DOPA 4,5-dioxygenase
MSATYHAHIYFGARTRGAARRVHDGLRRRFGVDCRWRDRPVGPHTRPNVRVRFGRGAFGRVVPWLMRHREGLSILVHPYSADHLADHTARALWLGAPVRLRLDVLRALTRRPSGGGTAAPSS